jgi:DNA-binding NarL/FixJ family response regulator
MRPCSPRGEDKRSKREHNMNLDVLTFDQHSADSYQKIRDVLEKAFSETLNRMAGGQGLEHFLLQLLREPGGQAPRAPDPIPAPRLPLSEREYQVLRRVAAGDSNKEIARALNLSLHTVKRHVANIFNKLGVESRIQAASFLDARH